MTEGTREFLNAKEALTFVHFSFKLFVESAIGYEVGSRFVLAYASYNAIVGFSF